MLKTSKDLMEWLGLQIGDRIKVNFTSNMFKEGVIYEVVNDKISVNQIHLKVVNTNYGFIMIDLHYLVNFDFEILPKPKRVGDLEIDDKDIYYKYKLVPLLDYKSNLCDWGIGVPEPKNLYEVLEHWQKYNKDQEIYDLLKARLDKEVKSDETD